MKATNVLLLVLVVLVLPLGVMSWAAVFSLGDVLGYSGFSSQDRGTTTSDIADFLAEGKRTAAMADITQIGAALTTYAIKNGQYPESLEALIQRDDNGYRILDRGAVPTDPWGNEYVYKKPYPREDLKVISYGADGRPGGEGEDSDLEN